MLGSEEEAGWVDTAEPAVDKAEVAALELMPKAVRSRSRMETRVHSSMSLPFPERITRVEQAAMAVMVQPEVPLEPMVAVAAPEPSAAAS